MGRALRRLRGTLCATMGVALLVPAAFADTASDLVKSLQLVASPTAVKQRADWRVQGSAATDAEDAITKSLA